MKTSEKAFEKKRVSTSWIKLWAPLSSEICTHGAEFRIFIFFNCAFKHFPVHNPSYVGFARPSKCCWQPFLQRNKTSYPGEAKAESFLTPNNIHWCGHLVSHGNPVFFLFMLLSTLINQEVRRFYFKLQKMFILSGAMTISYMAYQSLQRKEKVFRNSQGKLIFKAVGGRRGKENKHQQKSHRNTKPSTAFWHHTHPWLAFVPPLVPVVSPSSRDEACLVVGMTRCSHFGQMAAPSDWSVRRSRRAAFEVPLIYWLSLENKFSEWHSAQTSSGTTPRRRPRSHSPGAKRRGRTQLAPGAHARRWHCQVSAGWHTPPGRSLPAARPVPSWPLLGLGPSPSQHAAERSPGQQKSLGDDFKFVLPERDEHRRRSWNTRECCFSWGGNDGSMDWDLGVFITKGNAVQALAPRNTAGEALGFFLPAFEHRDLQHAVQLPPLLHALAVAHVQASAAQTSTTSCLAAGAGHHRSPWLWASLLLLVAVVVTPSHQHQSLQLFRPWLLQKKLLRNGREIRWRIF